MQSKKSEIGHRGLLFNCPHTEDQLSGFLELLQLETGGNILDIGCGKGELMCRIAEKYDCNALGIDSNSNMIENIRPVSKGSVSGIVVDMEKWLRDESPSKKYDLIVCIGSLRQGKQAEMLMQLTQMLSPSGMLLIGELVWIAKPSKEFLDFLNMKESDYCDEEEMKYRLTNCGLTKSYYSDVVTLTEYESAILKNIEDWSVSEEGIADEDREVILKMSRGWNEFSTKHAQSTWAFSTNLVGK